MFAEENKKEKKAFDSTVCFTFYGSWVEAITAVETESDNNSTSYRLFKAIADYAMYGVEPDFSALDNMALNAMWPLISNEIDYAVDRRKRGFAAEGPNKRQRAVIDACAKYPGASCREIEKITGISSSTISRVMRKYAGIIKEQQKMNGYAVSAPMFAPAPAPAPVPNTISNTASNTVPDSDSVGTGQPGQMGQQAGMEDEPAQHRTMPNALDRYSRIVIETDADGNEMADVQYALYYTPPLDGEPLLVDGDLPF